MALGAACFVVWAISSLAWPPAYHQATWLPLMAPWGLRLADLLLHVAAVIVMWRAFAPRFIGLCAAIVYGLWYAGGGPALVGLPEGWIALGSVLCFAPLLFKRVPDWGFALAGAFAAFATMVAPTYVVLLAVPMVAWLAQRRARALVFTIAGFVVPVAGCVVSSQHAALALGDALLAGVPTDLGALLSALGEHALASKLTLLLPFAAFGAYALRGRFPRRFHIIGAWTLAALVASCLRGGLGEAAWLPLYPPLFVFGTVGLKVIARTAMPFVLVTLAVMFAQAAWTPLQATWAWLCDGPAASLTRRDGVVARDASTVEARLAAWTSRVEARLTRAADVTPPAAHAAAHEAQANARHAIGARVDRADLTLGDERMARAVGPDLACAALARLESARHTEATKPAETTETLDAGARRADADVPLGVEAHPFDALDRVPALAVERDLRDIDAVARHEAGVATGRIDQCGLALRERTFVMRESARGDRLGRRVAAAVDAHADVVGGDQRPVAIGSLAGVSLRRADPTAADQILTRHLALAEARAALRFEACHKR